MATGDVQGSVERLRSELRHIRYPAEVDATGAKLGVPAAFLPVLNYVLLKFSRHVAHQLVSAGYELHGKTDARFVEVAFKVLRDKFGLRPVLTVTQFLEQGFAERKLMLMSDVIAYCKSYHNAAVRRARLAAASAPSKSAKEGATSVKGALSQVSKGSRKSKAKSGASKALQPRVQRHSDLPEQADEAILQARLGPSTAQLANSDQPQNESCNPWGPAAHAMGNKPAHSGLSQAVYAPQTHPASGLNIQPYGRAVQTITSSQERKAPEALRQPQDRLLYQLGPGTMQPAAQHDAQQQANQPRSKLDASQAWFVNPAFGSESPMPSPEKQPRSQPPPLPHPSGFSGAVQNAAQHPTAQSSQILGVPKMGAHVQTQHTRPELSQGFSGSIRSHQTGQPHQLESSGHGLGYDALEGTGGRHQPSSQHASALQTRLQPHQQMHHLQGLSYVGNAAMTRHAGASLPWQARHPEHQEPSQQFVMHDSAHQGSQHAQQASAWSGSHQQASAQSGSQHRQMPGALASPLYQEPQHLHAMLPLQGADCNAGHEPDILQSVQQLRQQLAAAEARAVQASQESERRVHTLEARITLLEGRVRMVEGELAAERERKSPTAAKDVAISSGTRHSGKIAACPSPSGVKSRQHGVSAVQVPAASADQADVQSRQHEVPAPSANQADDRPLHTRKVQQDASASPTKSTAATPRFKLGMAATRQSGGAAMMHQSPVRLLKPTAMPASPASSMHSYKSTSELIESIQNRYLEAQSFLKSYKF